MSIPLSLQASYDKATKSISKCYTKYQEQLDFVEPRLQEAMSYALLNGGKRVRPLLVYITGQMLGVEDQKLEPLACAIECIHAYSLTHDDLPAMDDDDLRRGKPSCHIQFDEATAILAGDALQTAAFDILASTQFKGSSQTINAKLVSALCKAAGAQGMVGGQSIDLYFTNKSISLDQLRQLHALKTGAMIRTSIELPSILAECLSKDDYEHLITFAEHMGMAFQIKDDILDVTADTKTLGKPQGSDENANKSTFVSLLGLQEAQNELAKQHQLAIHALSTLPYNTKALKEFADFMLKRSF